MENKTEKAYKEIWKVLNKHKDICVFDFGDLERKSKCHLFGVELKEKHKLDVEPKRINSLDWQRFGDYLTIGRWGDGYNRTISWPDNGEQPNNELLLEICFPTGAFIFGEDYPVNLFQNLFDELKTYSPKYLDTANKGLYFSMDNAFEIFNNFNSVLKKYNEINQKDFKRRKIEKMKAELEKLEE